MGFSMSTLTRKLLTAEEFARMPTPVDGSRQELVRGEVITMPPPSHLHGRVQIKVGYVFESFLSKNPIGQATVNSGVITETGPDSVRGPDVAFWSIERMPLDAEPVVYANVAPDLCVEILSPSNRTHRMQEKVREYFASGVRMVWVVNPDQRTVTIYRQPSEGRTLWEDAIITGEDVLPGFECRIADFFPPLPTAPPSPPPSA
jgi:Uma2 family endonuclease